MNFRVEGAELVNKFIDTGFEPIPLTQRATIA